VSHLKLDLSHVELHPKQARAVYFRSPRHPDTGEMQIDNVGFFGDYGGGKSYAMMVRTLLGAWANPFDHEVHSGDNPPMTGLVAPTFSDLKRGPLAQLSRVLGKNEEKVVARKVEYGQDQHWELVNGHKILLYSAAGAKNGPTLCQIATDEYQERCYLGQWDNLKGRVRDLRSPWLNVMASGIAQRGHVQDAFQLPERDPESGLPFCSRDDDTGNKLTVLLYPEDNDHLAAGYVEGMQGRSGERRTRDQDGWLLPLDALYPSFSRRHHLRMPPGMESLGRSDLQRLPVSVAVDPGRKAAVIWFMPVRIPVPGKKPVRGILIVDQWMPRDMDAEEIAMQIPKRGWRIEPATGRGEESVICFDPDVKADQVRHFTERFQARPVVHRSGFYMREENGERAVQRALRGADGVQRLYVAPWVHHVSDEDAGHEPDKGRRGVVEALGGYLATRRKDRWLEHAADVIRYAVQYACPLPKLATGIDPTAAAKLERAPNHLGRVRAEDLG